MTRVKLWYKKIFLPSAWVILHVCYVYRERHASVNSFLFIAFVNVYYDYYFFIYWFILIYIIKFIYIYIHVTTQYEPSNNKFTNNEGLHLVILYCYAPPHHLFLPLLDCDYHLTTFFYHFKSFATE